MLSVPLSTLSYLLMGMVSARGTATSPELLDAARRALRGWWHVPQSRLCSEPARLVQRGMLERAGASPTHHALRLTAGGRRLLGTWLSGGIRGSWSLRDEVVLELLFAEAEPVDHDLRAEAAAHRAAAHRERAEQLAARLTIPIGAVDAVAALHDELATEAVAIRLWHERASGLGRPTP